MTNDETARDGGADGAGAPLSTSIIVIIAAVVVIVLIACFIAALCIYCTLRPTSALAISYRERKSNLSGRYRDNDVVDRANDVGFVGSSTDARVVRCSVAVASERGARRVHRR